MELFLVRANISYRLYMSNREHEFEDFRLVRAVDDEAAEEKYKAFWYAKDRAYDISYHVKLEEVSGVIE